MPTAPASPMWTPLPSLFLGIYLDCVAMRPEILGITDKPARWDVEVGHLPVSFFGFRQVG